MEFTVQEPEPLDEVGANGTIDAQRGVHALTEVPGSSVAATLHANGMSYRSIVAASQNAAAFARQLQELYGGYADAM